MAWTVTHNATDITGYCSLVGMTLTAGAVSGGRSMRLKIVPGESGFVPARNADVIFTDGDGARRWAGRIQGVERIDIGEVAGISAAAVYEVDIADIASLLSQRVIPPAGGLAARQARRLPPSGLEAKYDGTFRPLSTAKRIPVESALDWALALIETTEANNEPTKGRIIPAFQVGAASGANFINPDYRGVGHEMVDLARFPAAASATYSASSNSANAYLATDNDPATSWAAGTGAGPYWQALFSADQTVSMIFLQTGPTTAWTDMRVELRDGAGAVLRTCKFGAVPINTTKQYIWEGDVPNVRAIRIRDASASTASGRGLARVSSYDTYPLYLTAAAKVGDRKGNMLIADAFAYGEMINNICDRAQLGWYVDPGDASGPILRTYSLTQPPLASYEIGDSATQTPVVGSTMVMARTISLEENSGDIVNRVVAQYGLEGATKNVVVPDDPATRGGLAALARASQTLYGLREKRLGDQSIKTKDAALTAAQRELARALGPEVSGSIRVPYDPSITPGNRVYIHRGNHLPAIAPKDYYVAVGFIKEVTWTFEDTGTDPFWCDLTIADPDGSRVGFVEGLTGSVQRVAKAAIIRPTVGGVERSADEAEAPSEIPWGTYSTYVIDRPTTAAAAEYSHPPYSRIRGRYYNYNKLIATGSGRAYYLPNVVGAHADSTSPANRSLEGAAAPFVWGLVPPAVTGTVIRARAFIPIRRLLTPDNLVTEITARTLPNTSKGWTDSYYSFSNVPGSPYTAVQAYARITGGRHDLKSGNYSSAMLTDDATQMIELDIPWSNSLTAGTLADVLWMVFGPSALSTSTAPIVTGGTGRDSTQWPGLTSAHSPSQIGYSNYLWDPANPSAGILGFDPRDPDPAETNGYVMLMVNTGAVLTATPGSYVERPLTFGADRVKILDLGQPFEPESLTVFVNGRKCREDKGDFELVYSGDMATGFNVSGGTNPIRARGLRNYKAKNGSRVRDVVVVRYKVA
jgi:hypothetical protein